MLPRVGGNAELLRVALVLLPRPLPAGTLSGLVRVQLVRLAEQAPSTAVLGTLALVVGHARLPPEARGMSREEGEQRLRL
jgi:predicted ABC-type sugar transport system permease subunit